MIVLFHVQHLLGIGHLTRAATLARSLAAGGFEVTVVSGGEPVPGVDFGRARLVQLPPARVADRRFKHLLDARGQPAGDAWKADRRERLLALYEEVGPDLVLTELFPFGRRQLRFELLPLLDRAAGDRARTGRPRIACSVRDILVESPKPERTREMLALVRRYYDRVLVHGDPRFVSLDATFPHVREIADRIAYTGYVVARPTEGGRATPSERESAGLEPDPSPGATPSSTGRLQPPRIGGCEPDPPPGANRSPAGPHAPAEPLPAVENDAGPERSREAGGEVIVSAGGGAVGGRLLGAALAARPETSLATADWRLLAGANLPESDFRSLAARAPAGVTVERFRPDFGALVRRARLSISQGGYNTLMEVLDGGLRAVVVPYAGGLETEQTLRASLLARRGLIEVVGEDELGAGSLAAAVERVLAKPAPAGLAGLDTSGASTTVRALRGLLATR